LHGFTWAIARDFMPAMGNKFPAGKNLLGKNGGFTAVPPVSRRKRSGTPFATAFGVLPA
jgi:hypothetical protein